MAQKYRTLPDGSVIFPNTGSPPRCPVGFMPDSDNRFRFVPIITDCPYRKRVTSNSPCHGVYNYMRCMALDTQVTYKICQRCTPEWRDYDPQSAPSDSDGSRMEVELLQVSEAVDEPVARGDSDSSDIPDEVDQDPEDLT